MAQEALVVRLTDCVAGIVGWAWLAAIAAFRGTMSVSRIGGVPAIGSWRPVCHDKPPPALR